MSTDSGTTWSPTGSDIGYLGLLVLSADGTQLVGKGATYVGATNSYIFSIVQSLDDGASWTTTQ